MSRVEAYGLSSTGSKSARGEAPRAFGLPLRSKAALEQNFELELPSPPPPLREGVTEVHYSRWVVEEANKDVGDELRQFHQNQKSFRKGQMERFLKKQHQKVEDSHHQMASASASVETVRLKNLETGQEMRLNLLELKQSVHLEKQVHSAKGRELVENAKHVQSAKVLERQLSHRGKKQAVGAKTKSEREQLTARRETNTATEEERKRDIASRVKAETQSEVVGRSKEVVAGEKTQRGNDVRDNERLAVEKRERARQLFLSRFAENRREVDAIKEGAKSARAGLQSHRLQQANEVRSARMEEREKKKKLVEDMKRRNREVHDMIYATKVRRGRRAPLAGVHANEASGLTRVCVCMPRTQFAPRARATQVNLPGRIGKTAFNAFDAEAAAAENAAAPAALDAAGGPGSFGGLGGMPPSPMGGRRGSTMGGSPGGWNDDA